MEAAINEHHLVLVARAAALVDGSVVEGERAQVCGDVARECGLYFQSTGAVWVLQAAVVAARASLRLTTERHPDRAVRLSNLGALLSLAVEEGLVEPGVLAESLDYQREAYRLTPEDHPDRAGRASNIGALIGEAVHAGLVESGSLVEAVTYARESYRLAPEGNPDRAQFASNLGALLAMAVETGVIKPGALVEAVACQREAYRLTPEGHPDRAGYGSNLGGRIGDAVKAGFLERRALVEAIDYEREAYELTPEGDSHRARYGSNLSNRIADAVQVGLLEPGALVEAVAYQREAYRLTPDGHSDRALFASNAGRVLGDAVQAGVIEPGVLAEAVDYEREAYRLTVDGHAHRAQRASHLSIRIAMAVDAGVIARGSLVEAVAYAREAYLLTPEEHPDRAAYAASLGDRLADAVEAGIAHPGLLAEALDYQREGCRLTPEGHPHRAGFLSNLGNVLAQAVLAGVVTPGVLTEAVEYHREAYRLTPEDHLHRAIFASTLGNRLADAVRVGLIEPSALAEAVEYQREAYRLTPEGHPRRAIQASNLGSQLAVAVQGGVVEQGMLAQAVGEASNLLDEVWRVARGGVTLTRRHRVLATTLAVTGRLPLMLLRCAGPREAVRAVEALRGHLTGGMHAPELPPGMVDPALETAYRKAAIAYEAAQTRAREGVASYADAVPAAARLAELVEQVRASAADRGGFGGRPQFTDLCAGLPANAAAIYLLPAPAPVTPNPTEEWPGAAVIVRGDGRTAQVPLPELTRAAVTERADALLATSTAAQQVCAWLWHVVAAPLLADVSPVLAEVSEWVVVPSGFLGLLPLHAAGSTQTGWLDDHVTVRVAPSLLALAERTHPITASGSPVVAVTSAPDLPLLIADRAVAQALIPGCAALAEPVDANTVLEALVDAPVAVLSGHAVHSVSGGGGLDFGGKPDELEGTRRPRWLTAEAVERLPLRDRDLVFLSACSSGQTATDLPDEAIGLPAAFRHAGFRTVIATTWPVQDSVAFITLARFLEHRAAHPRDSAATALRQTRRWLRTATREHLAVWLDGLVATAALPGDLTRSLLQWWMIDCADPTPYADPQDWGPFAATGH